MTITDTRTVPYDEDAEAAVIGGMLLPAPHRDLGRILEAVTVDDFWKPEHRTIAQAVVKVFITGQIVDHLTVGAVLDHSVPRERLLQLQMATPGTHATMAHAEIVKRLALLRRGIQMGDQLQALGYAQDLDALVEAAEDAPARLRPQLTHVDTYDLDDLAALADQDEITPAKPWVIPGLLRLNEVVVITGGEGLGKSTFSRQCAVCVASGIHPLLGIPLGDDPQPTLIVDLQEDDTDLAYAVRPLRKRAGDAYERGMVKAVAWPAGVNLLARRDISRLESVIAAHRPTLVVMGPLVRMFRAEGKRSRYSEDLVDELTDNLDQLRVRYGFSLILEGHAGNDRTSGEDAWRPRGSSVWRSWPSVGIGLEPVSFAPREAKVHAWRWSRYADRAWPRRLVTGGGWPWGLDSEDYEKLCRKLGHDWLIDGAETEMTF